MYQEKVSLNLTWKDKKGLGMLNSVKTILLMVGLFFLLDYLVSFTMHCIVSMK